MDEKIELSFKEFREYCRYSQLGFDEYTYPNVQLTCRHKENIPHGCSWGECNTNKCPLIKSKNI